MLNENLLIFSCVVVGACLYTAWRAKVALDCREYLAEEVDNYLATDAPEHFKRLAYMNFEGCLDPFRMLKTTWFVIFGSKKHGITGAELSDEVKRRRNAFDPEEIQTYQILSKKLFKIGLKRAPFTVFTSTIILFIYWIFFVDDSIASMFQSSIDKQIEDYQCS
jgi:hypothetical protein